MCYTETVDNVGKTLYVMQGVPGSGKSVLARMIVDWYRQGEDPAVESPRVAIVSTDDFRMAQQWWCHDHGRIGGTAASRPACPECPPRIATQNVYLSDTYAFDPEDNKRYHLMAQQKAVELMATGIPAVIIDNTNIQEWQAHPYLVVANIYGYTVQVVSVDCGLGLAIDRQQGRRDDRQVPPMVIAQMYQDMERILAQPSYMPKELVDE